MKKLSTYIIAFIFTIGCVSKSDYNKLKGENDRLQAELNEFKEGPQKLLANIKINYEASQYVAAKVFFDQLKDKYPDSQEYSDAKLIYDEIIEIEKIEEEKQQAERLKKIAEQEALEAEKLKSLNKLRKKFDDVSGITWYRNPYFTHYTNSNGVSIYIGKHNEGQPWVRLMMSYSDSDWLFFERAFLSYEGNTIEIEFDRYRNKETDHNGGKIWEWIDVTADDSIIKYLWEFSNSKEPKVRYTGKYTKTRNLSFNEKQGIKDVLMGYMALTGKQIN